MSDLSTNSDLGQALVSDVVSALKEKIEKLDAEIFAESRLIEVKLGENITLINRLEAMRHAYVVALKHAELKTSAQPRPAAESRTCVWFNFWRFVFPVSFTFCWGSLSK